MRKYIIIGFFALFYHTNSFSQYLEVGVFAGVSNYFGDLSPDLFEPSLYLPSYGGFVRYNFTGRLALKGHAYKGTLQGADYHAQQSQWTRSRNLSFRTDIYELGLQAEFNFLNLNIVRRKNISTPYIFVGGSGFYFNPQALYNGQYVDLQPLGTEGQGLPGNAPKYQLYSFAALFGAGAKFSINKRASFGIEIGLRYAMTDYIDDVSTSYPDIALLQEQGGDLAVALSYRTPEYDDDIVSDPSGTVRGSAGMNDIYMFGGLTISVNLGKVKDFGAKKAKARSKAKAKPKMEF